MKKTFYKIILLSALYITPILLSLISYQNNIFILFQKIIIGLISFFLLFILLLTQIKESKKHNQNSEKYRNNLEWIEFYILLCFLFMFFICIFPNMNNLLKELAVLISRILIIIFIVIEFINQSLLDNKIPSKYGKNVIWLFMLIIATISFLVCSSYQFVIIEYNYKAIFLRLIYIFSILYLIFYSINKFKAINNKNFKLTIIELVINCLIIIVLIVLIFNKLFDKEIANAIISIIAAIIGGSLTLVGVAWTIKQQDREKRIDEKNKAKPYLKLQSSFVINKNIIHREIKDILNRNNFVSDITSALVEDNIPIIDYSQNKAQLCIESCVIKNTENAVCIIRGLEINFKYVSFIKPFLLEKNELFQLFGVNLWFNILEEIKDLKLIFSDTNENWYNVQLVFKRTKCRVQRKNIDNLFVDVGIFYEIVDIELPIDYKNY